VPVAKHGNRSVSSRCGSADVLEAAGVRLDVTPEAMTTLHDEVGIAFLFAPRLHPAMKAVMPIRRTLGVRTVFNLLGPLTNPAGVERQVIGVWGSDVQELMAAALADLGARHALVVHSDDGLDEISVCAPTVNGGLIRRLSRSK
jgi:anthranilate phosphoribosyltransferase